LYLRNQERSGESGGRNRNQKTFEEVKFNNDFRHDLEVGQIGEKLLADILENKTIEVKKDLKAMQTGNVFIEYSSRGKRSGLSTSQADWWALIVSEEVIKLVKTDYLKELCRPYIGTKRDVLGGDNDTSKGILLPVKKI
jgi:hypothetical protein